MLHMTETMKAEVDEESATRFRKKAVERYRYKNGAMKKALEEAMRRYSPSGKAHWIALAGTLKSGRDSVWLQHHGLDFPSTEPE